MVSALFFRFYAICYQGSHQGEAAGATADRSDVQTFPITYIRFGMTS